MAFALGVRAVEPVAQDPISERERCAWSPHPNPRWSILDMEEVDTAEPGDTVGFGGASVPPDAGLEVALGPDYVAAKPFAHSLPDPEGGASESGESSRRDRSGPSDSGVAGAFQAVSPNLEGAGVPMTQTPARSELVWPQPVDPTKAPFVLKDGEEGARWGSLRMQGQSVQHRLTSAAAELNKALGELSGIPDMIQVCFFPPMPLTFFGHFCAGHGCRLFVGFGSAVEPKVAVPPSGTRSAVGRRVRFASPGRA
jgi:hypothetical protein